ncbi:hypothetical protein TNCV_2537111 [Trichonephila clavipes]|nr:hypothetical protein TNCV_2537111 [Trichonephila clavipes]
MSMNRRNAQTEKGVAFAHIQKHYSLSGWVGREKLRGTFQGMGRAQGLSLAGDLYSFLIRPPQDHDLDSFNRQMFYSRRYAPKNWEFWTICQLATMARLHYYVTSVFHVKA